MHRRAAVSLGLIGLLLSLTTAGAAQPAGKVWRLGAFHVGLDHVPPSLDGLREGLKSLGYEEGRNLRLDWRNLPDEAAARKTAAEFVRERVDVIVAFESQTVRAAKAATAERPIVFLHVTDPVVDGMVASLAHPGGNLTGIADTDFELFPKSLEIFREFLPPPRRLLVLSDPEDPATARLLVTARQAAATLELRLVERQASSPAELDRVFAGLKRGEVQGVFIVSPSLHTKFPSAILRLAARSQLALSLHRKEWVAQGALFSYGYDFVSVGRAAAVYVDKLLKGARPADLPVEQPTKFELAVNARTAAALGLTVPPSVRLRANQMFE